VKKMVHWDRTISLKGALAVGFKVDIDVIPADVAT
jgi:hypothetical protein